MKIKKSASDRIFYILLCIATLGSVWVIRVVISESIRYALLDNQ